MSNSQDKSLGFGPDAGRTGTDTQSQAAGAGHVIFTYSQTVLEQPSDNIPQAVITAAPYFITHLKTAQSNALHFNKDILPVMSQNVSDLLSFSNTWSSFSPDMKKYAEQGKYDVVAQGLQIMQKNIKTYATKADQTHKLLIDFQSTVTGDARAFTSDYNALTSSEKGLPAQIHALDKEIDAENSAIDKFAAMIAGGAAAALLGGIMVVGGLMAEELSFGTSTAVVVSGLLVAGGGIALIVVGSKGIGKASNAIRNATSQKASLNKELASLKAYQTTMASLKSSVGNAVSAIGNLSQSWDYLYEDMNAVISDLKTASSTVKLPWFNDTMNAADKDWDQVGSMAKAVQQQTADAKYKSVDLSKPGSSLLDALPKEDRERMLAA